MDLTIIEEEVYKFNKEFFYKISKAAEEFSDFIEENSLHVPKENYTLLSDFLYNTLTKFRVLDSSFMSSTLKKISIDVQETQTLYKDTIENSKDINHIFESEFLPSSESFSLFEKEVSNDKDNIKLSQMLIELKEIYYTSFYEIFHLYQRYIDKSLMINLNLRIRNSARL